MEPVGPAIEAAKAAAQIKFFSKLPPSSQSKATTNWKCLLPCVWVIAFLSCARKYQLSAELPQWSNGGVILYMKK